MRSQTVIAGFNAGAVIGYTVLFAVAFWLLFYHLDSHLLWGDEAETAVLAKNVVQFGVPRTFDGTNYILLHGTVDETPGHIWIWSPWMQNYLAASSFILFGPTTWAARAPFAFIGWCSVLLLAAIAAAACVAPARKAALVDPMNALREE